jgi:hypothetical protein
MPQPSIARLGHVGIHAFGIEIRESVAEHGKEGVVDMRALQMQDIAAPGQ